jgi:hypothetical protein
VVRTIAGHAVVSGNDHDVVAKFFHDGSDNETHGKAISWLGDKRDKDKRVTCYIRQPLRV